MKVDKLAGPLGGVVALPGDKSISHRALILASLAHSSSRLRHIGSGADNKATIQCLRALGIGIETVGDEIVVDPRPLKEPSGPLDCLNSGTTMRLLSGLCAGAGIEAQLIGDESLSRRPMKRVAEPLSALGAVLQTTEGHAPLFVRPHKLSGAEVKLKEPSAQVKTAMILAALYAEGTSVITEPEPTRDHSERMLAALGFALAKNGDEIVVEGGHAPPPGFSLWVPGDPSSSAFWAVLAALVPDSDVTLVDVSLNPLRLAYADVLERMGVNIERVERGETAGEPWGDLRFRGGERLKATDVGGHEARLAIDELPVLAVAMAFAQGKSHVTGAKDLRTKESDRIETTAELIRAAGIEIETEPEGFVIVGGKPKHARASAHDDHRIALAAAVLGLAGEGTIIDGYESAGVSYGQFLRDVERLRGQARPRGKPITVAIDGPAGAGKSTVARKLAERLGYRLVDTGAVYRTVALLARRGGVDMTDGEALALIARNLIVQFKPGPGGQRVFAGEKEEDVTDAIRTGEMSQLASVVSQHPGVRAALLHLQRSLAGAGGAVLEGRDIGTVVFPEAQAKFFLDAAPEERARRRQEELLAKNAAADFEHILSEIRDRDRARQRPRRRAAQSRRFRRASRLDQARRRRRGQRDGAASARQRSVSRNPRAEKSVEVGAGNRYSSQYDQIEKIDVCLAFTALDFAGRKGAF